jgi:hypothetical protein
MGSSVVRRVVGAGVVMAVLGALGAGLAPPLAAETPDVGQTLDTAGDAVGVTSVTGTLAPSTDVDLYRICVASGASFGVSVSAAGGDGQLFLFGPTGLGVAWNDDKADRQLEPSFPPGGAILSALTPGYYFLGLSNYNIDPASAGGAIFADRTFPDADPVEAATGPGRDQPLLAWAGNPGTQFPLITDYTMTLTGVGSCAAPVLALPPPVVVPATSAAGAVVTFTASATDWLGDAVPVSCDVPSGSTFPIGVTPVSCTATDFLGQPATGGFTVTVTNTPPEVSVPADLTVAATSPAGAQVTFTATATDAEEGAITPVCEPVSGSTFPIGSTTVTCTATDFAGLSGSASFSVTVFNTSPVISVPADLSVPATSAAGAPVTFTATGSDAEDGPLTPTCEPPSGSTFPIGRTSVTCTVTDAAGDSASGSFRVTVTNTAPTVSVPADVTVEATSAAGAVVTFDATATDAEEGAITPVCVPASGSAFPIGTTTVTCTATDFAGLSGAASFSVTVRPAGQGLRFSGFYPPVADPPAVNTVTRGSTVPIKFNVYAGDAVVSDTGVVTSITYAPVDCTSGEPTGAARPAASAGGSSLRWDPEAGQFVFTWKTPATGAACVELTVTLADGSSYGADFRFRSAWSWAPSWLAHLLRWLVARH